MNNYHSGHFAEFVVMIFLRIKGYRKIAVNYRQKRGTGAGEVDLILAKNQTLIFVEVKKRKTITAAAYSILPAQQKRIRRAAEVFLKQHKQYTNYGVRFDAVLVQFPFYLEHIKNAF